MCFVNVCTLYTFIMRFVKKYKSYGSIKKIEIKMTSLTICGFVFKLYNRSLSLSQTTKNIHSISHWPV